MSHNPRARTAPRRTRRVVPLAVTIILTVIIGAFGHQFLSSVITSPGDVPGGASPGPPGEADGAIPDGAVVTALDDLPAVTELDPELLDALRRATGDARAENVEIRINSGWRSAAYQEQLLREAVAEYGSEEEAKRWVATAETSAHVSGEAVDLGRAEATSWLSRRGLEYGLCQTYANESWHYEVRPAAVDRGCPPQYPDPTADPRMQQ